MTSRVIVGVMIAGLVVVELAFLENRAKLVPPSVTTAASIVSKVPGPSFDEVNSHIVGATDVQAATYFDTVKGTTVVWTGTVTQVTYAQNGAIVVQMTGGTSPSANGIDAYLDGTQNNLATSINRGRVITVRGILDSRTVDVWRSATYNIAQSHIQ